MHAGFDLYLLNSKTVGVKMYRFGGTASGSLKRGFL